MTFQLLRWTILFIYNCFYSWNRQTDRCVSIKKNGK